MDGSHNIDKCYQVTTNVLNECYNELNLHKVDLKGTVLKPNMIIPGSDCKDKSSSQEIAQKNSRLSKKKCTYGSSRYSFFIWWTVRNRV